MLELAPPSEKMTYDEAIMYCFWLEHDGKKGWRMPTHEEWAKTKGIMVYTWRQNDHRTMMDTMPVVPVRGQL
jgi:hypothetical protein